MIQRIAVCRMVQACSVGFRTAFVHVACRRRRKAARAFAVCSRSSPILRKPLQLPRGPTMSRTSSDGDLGTPPRVQPAEKLFQA